MSSRFWGILFSSLPCLVCCWEYSLNEGYFLHVIAILLTHYLVVDSGVSFCLKLHIIVLHFLPRGFVVFLGNFHFQKISSDTTGKT